MRYYVIRSTGMDGASSKDVLAIERPRQLDRRTSLGGTPLAKVFPSPLDCAYDRDWSGGTRLTDLVPNAFSLHPVSPRLRAVLSLEKKLEFLPLRILDAKGKVAAADYALANYLAPVACVDRKKSTRSDENDFEKLVLDPKKVPAHRHAFRLAECPTLVIIDDELRARIEAEGLTGIGCIPVEKYSALDELRYLGGHLVAGNPPKPGKKAVAPVKVPKLKLKTKFGPRMSFAAAVSGLEEAFAAVARSLAGDEVPLRRLALGITSDTGRPILQLETGGGRETNFGYLWSFPGCEALDRAFENFGIAGEGDDHELKLAAAATVARTWGAIPVKKAPTVHQSVDEGPLSKRTLDALVAKAGRAKK